MTQRPNQTQTAGQRAARGLREAVITGYVLRLARESVPAGCSQERLAEILGVSADTVAGWETGRRPLTAVKVGHVVLLRSALVHAGASARLVRLLDVAMEADLILDHARSVADRHEAGDVHPLGALVYRREVVELAAWPLSARTPKALPLPAAGRRGPVAVGPDIGAAQRELVFDHLRRVAETSGSRDSLLSRQALYLLSYDRRRDAAAWMAEQYRRVPRQCAGWSPYWPVVRTLAASLVRYGDPGALLDFAHAGLADEQGHTANLNYWAYWVGETTAVERDDSFMPAGLGPWRGDQILRHLVSHLDAEDGVADLGVHTLRTLLAARPRLLDEDRDVTAALAAAVEHAGDAGKMSGPARQALAEIRYALRLYTR